MIGTFYLELIAILIQTLGKSVITALHFITTCAIVDAFKGLSGRVYGPTRHLSSHGLVCGSTHWSKVDVAEWLDIALHIWNSHESDSIISIDQPNPLSIAVIRKHNGQKSNASKRLPLTIWPLLPLPILWRGAHDLQLGGLGVGRRRLLRRRLWLGRRRRL